MVEILSAFLRSTSPRSEGTRADPAGFVWADEVDFTNARFDSAKPADTDFSRSTFTEADFEGTDMAHANFSGADLTGVKHNDYTRAADATQDGATIGAWW